MASRSVCRQWDDVQLSSHESAHSVSAVTGVVGLAKAEGSTLLVLTLFPSFCPGLQKLDIDDYDYDRRY